MKNSIVKYFEDEDKGARGLYVHIPFCHRKCYYCDFLTFPGQEKRMGSYVDSLVREMEIYREKYEKISLDSIFLGGGSPSYLGLKDTERLLRGIRDNFDILGSAEFTIEMNPEDVKEDKLKILRDFGVNRVSLGVQTFSDPILEALGRVHTSNEAIEAFDLLRKEGFQNINLDMISSLPFQSEEDLDRDIGKIIELSPDHVSYYSLILEEATYLHRLVREGKISLPGDDFDRKAYHNIVGRLEEAGLIRYEISNFSRESFQSIHNKKYWLCKEVLGLGLGSSGFFKGARYKNTRSLREYESKIAGGQLPIEEKTYYTDEEFRTDYIITNMRLSRGIDLTSYEEIFGISLLNERKKEIDLYIEGGFLESKDNRIYFTLDGVDISNKILVDLI